MEKCTVGFFYLCFVAVDLEAEGFVEIDLCDFELLRHLPYKDRNRRTQRQNLLLDLRNLRPGIGERRFLAGPIKA